MKRIRTIEAAMSESTDMMATMTAYVKQLDADVLAFSQRVKQLKEGGNEVSVLEGGKGGKGKGLWWWRAGNLLGVPSTDWAFSTWRQAGAKETLARVQTMTKEVCQPARVGCCGMLRECRPPAS
jgi:hypothetical protein